MSWRDSLWPRIMALHAQFDAMEKQIAQLPDSPDTYALRAQFRKAHEALVEARGAHSHGEWALFSWLRIGPLEQSAREIAAKLAWRLARVDLKSDA